MPVASYTRDQVITASASTFTKERLRGIAWPERDSPIP